MIVTCAQRLPKPFDHLAQGWSSAVRWQQEGDLDPKALTLEIVHYVQRPELPSVSRAFHHHGHRPNQRRGRSVWQSIRGRCRGVRPGPRDSWCSMAHCAGSAPARRGADGPAWSSRHTLRRFAHAEGTARQPVFGPGSARAAGRRSSRSRRRAWDCRASRSVNA